MCTRIGRRHGVTGILLPFQLLVIAGAAPDVTKGVVSANAHAMSFIEAFVMKKEVVEFQQRPDNGCRMNKRLMPDIWWQLVGPMNRTKFA